MSNTLLIVDDEADLLSGLKRSITMELDCEVLTASSGAEAIDILTTRHLDLILTDISMPGMNGMTLLDKIMEVDASATVIMMTAYGTIEIAVKALKHGAYDFIQKPFDFDALIRLLKKGFERSWLLKENCRMREQIGESSPLSNLVGSSKRMKQVHSQIQTLSRTDVTVLITGETGTGKDIAAQAIHQLSIRKEKPFITVNCPALPEGLLESELFGHKKGAFTGADSDKKGLFDQAAGSTIFLDEIGDLPLSLQTKLLRVLQNREVTPVGAVKSHKIDVRIIAATNQHLTEKIGTGEFRADLFYRLNVANLVMPPLREIREDIPLLVNHFLAKSACELKTTTKQMGAEVLTRLQSFD